jgi:homopolymeric O-antigen transport system permease protein
MPVAADSANVQRMPDHAPATRSAAPPIVRIRPPARTWRSLGLRELAAYHELLYFLVLRFLKIRYKQTIFGAGWAVLQPLLAMAVFALVFGRLARLPSDGLPYAVFAYAALVPWTYFANTLTQASNSLVDNERLLTKVYFPRALLPLAAVLAGLVDLAIALVVLLGLLAVYGVPLSSNVWSLPGFILLAALTAFAVGLWLSALNVRYRDVRHALPFLVQLWLFATPVAYATSLIPERWRAWYGLNPMVGVVDGFRWALLGGSAAPGPEAAASALAMLALLVGGLSYFRRTERTFADLV